jgi:hypothetical protein
MGNLSTNGTAYILEELNLQLLCCEKFENRTKQKQLFLFDYKVPEEK